MRAPTSSYASIQSFVRFLLFRWFRSVEVTGLEHLPDDRGGILVSWHPNGLVDPALIVASFPGQVIFGARHGLFRWPGLGHLMRAAGAVPIYRAADNRSLPAEERRKQNDASLRVLAEAVAGGGFSCLFPEGDSHDAPFVQELKTGVARFYLQAVAETPAGQPPPVILPVGLHYADKDTFRSHALVAFHPPLELEPALCTPTGDDLRSVRGAITDRIEEELREAVHALESWRLHHLMHRARKVVQSERARHHEVSSSAPTMREKAELLRTIWETYQRGLASRPDEVQHMLVRLDAYDSDMRVLELEDHELDQSPEQGQLSRIALLAAQLFVVFTLLPPLLVFGVVINAPAVALLTGASRLFAKRRKDEATIKLLVGALLLPASWALAGWLAYRGSTWLHRLDSGLPNAPWAAAAVVVSLAIVGGAAAMRYVRLLRATLRAMRVRLTRGRRRHAIARLRVEREELYDDLLALMRAVQSSPDPNEVPLP